MPTVFKAALDGSEAVRYLHVPLFPYFFRQAQAHAMASVSKQVEDEFKESLLTIIFCSLALEAFVNQMSEEKLEADELKAFRTLHKKYKRQVPINSITWKMKLVFDLYWQHSLPLDAEPLIGIERMAMLRNALVHYKLHESAGRAYMSPPRTTRTEGGGYMTAISFVEKPLRTEPSLVESVNRHEAARSFNALLRVARLWNECAGAPLNSLTSTAEIEVQEKI